MSQIEALAVAGIHGEEVYPGIPLIESIQDAPIPGAKGFIAHPEAVRLGLRKLEVNLAICLRFPELFPGTAEARLVPGIKEKVERAERVIDMHQQTQPDVTDDFIYIGPRVQPKTIGLIGRTGIKNVIISSCGLTGLYSHVALADIAPSSPRNDVDYWRAVVADMASGKTDTWPFTFSDVTLLAQDDMTVSERKQLGLMGTTYTPGQIIHGANEIYSTDQPVRALFGWDAGYTDGVEVAVQVDPHDIRMVDGVLHMPTLNRLQTSGTSRRS